MLRFHPIRRRPAAAASRTFLRPMRLICPPDAAIFSAMARYESPSARSVRICEIVACCSGIATSSLSSPTFQPNEALPPGIARVCADPVSAIRSPVRSRSASATADRIVNTSFNRRQKARRSRKAHARLVPLFDPARDARASKLDGAQQSLLANSPGVAQSTRRNDQNSRGQHLPD